MSDNNPDLSLERDILKKMDLTNEEKQGAEKFLEAISGIKGWDDGLDEILEEQFIPHNPSKFITDNQVTSLINNISEYMSSYILVGYDLGGNRVSFWSFPTQMAADASLVHITDAVEECKILTNEGKLNNE